MRLKPSKKWMIAGAIVLSTVAILAYFGEAWLEQIIRQSVEKKVAASPNFKCAEIELKLRPASIIFKDAVIDFDFLAEAHHLEVKSREIELGGIDWIQVIFFKKLKINKLHIESPFLMLSEIQNVDSLSNIKKAPTKGITSIQIKHLSLERGQFKIVKHPKDTLSSVSADNFDIDLEAFYFNIDKKGNSHSVKKVNLDIRNFLFHSKDKLHDIALSRLLLNKKDNTITLTDLTVKPKFNKQDFFSHVQKKQARLDIDFPSVVFHGWQLEQLLQGKFVVRTVEIKDMKLQVLANQNLPIDPKRYQPLPHEALLKARLGITIDSIFVENGRLDFENIAAGKRKPGLLIFNPLSAVFVNVTNDTARIRKQPIMAVEVVGNFQEKHKITNNFWMDLSSPDYAFTFTGQSAPIPFQQFNGFLTPSTNIVFEKGIISSIDYKVNADKSAARGKLNLNYSGLEFHWLNKKKKSSKFLSGLVDIFFIKNDNNVGDKDFQKGEIFVQRDTWRPFFGYWWVAIQSGLKTSILDDFELKGISKIKARQKSK